MWTEDLIVACEAFIAKYGHYTVTWASVVPAYDGIVFRMDNDISYKYCYLTKDFIEYHKNDWRKKLD